MARVVDIWGLLFALFCWFVWVVWLFAGYELRCCFVDVCLDLVLPLFAN